MKIRVKIIICIMIFGSSFSFGQMENYNYKRELTGVSEQWHKIILPNEIFGKTNQRQSDIRIFGITADNDTIEAPYISRLTKEKNITKNITFKILNESHNALGYFFTFEIPTNEEINQINLDFAQKNFDWRVQLEGSQDQQEWFTIIDNYRILSIKNDLTDFQFTKLKFPNSKYKFLRLFIATNQAPKLLSTKLSQRDLNEGKLRNYAVSNSKIIDNKKQKTTEIDINLSSIVSASQIKINIGDTFDFYRPVTIKYLADSFKTEKGWKYNYDLLVSGTLNSFEDNVFKFKSTTFKKLKINITNYDNQPLTFDSIEVKGYIHELFVRFTAPATYYLTYGNKNAGLPVYDISRFQNNIPYNAPELTLGAEQQIDKKVEKPAEPLFQNKYWLWGIMIIIILILGGFTMKMLSNK